MGTAIGLLTATQHAGTARFQGEGGGIGGNVGAALIDDGDDAHGDADALHLQAVGQGVLRNDAAYGVGQCHHLADALGHVGNASLRQGEAIQHHLGDVTAGRLHVKGVGCQNLCHRLHQGVRHGEEGAIFLLGSEGQQLRDSVLRRS